MPPLRPSVRPTVVRASFVVGVRRRLALPLAMTAMRSHMLSSSSRSVEISKTAMPRAAMSRMRWRVAQRVGEIEAVGRLVEDDHFGAVGQFTRQKHFLDIAARQPANRRLQARRAHVKCPHQLRGAAVDLAALDRSRGARTALRRYA